MVANPDRTPFWDNFRTASDPLGISSRIGLRSRSRLERSRYAADAFACGWSIGRGVGL